MSQLAPKENHNTVKGQIRYLETAEAYDLWSSVYDTDGNFLQALDSLEVPVMLSTAFSQLEDANVIDLGCGTGRNTLALFDHDPKHITAVDLSPKMLDIARSRCLEKASALNIKTQLEFGVFDMMAESSGPVADNSADIVISTLVLEHIPVEIFLGTVYRLLKSGGLCILTNMHSEMGGISQAGFVSESGDKIRPKSYAHTIEDVVNAAHQTGLDFVEPVDGKWKTAGQQLREITIDEELASKLGPRAKKWIGIAVWYGGILKKCG